MPKTLRVGMLGAGFMGQTHARCLTGMDGIEVVAVCDVDESRMAALNEAAGCSARPFTAFEPMLENAGLDVLYVCLPPFAHNGEVEQAAARGIHLFLEKPIAIDSVKAASMVSAIEAGGVVSQVGFHMRFREGVRKLKSMMEANLAGAPTLFTGRYWTNMDGSEWWRDRARSGGQILEQIVHIYDLATYLFGPVVKAEGAISNLCHQGRMDYTIEDTSVGVLHFENGATGVITGSNCAVPMHFFGDFRAVCEKVMLDYRCTGQTWVAPDRYTIYQGDQSPEEGEETEDAYLLESVDFIQAIREGRMTCTPARDGLHAIECIEKVLNHG